MSSFYVLSRLNIRKYLQVQKILITVESVILVISHLILTRGSILVRLVRICLSQWELQQITFNPISQNLLTHHQNLVISETSLDRIDLSTFSHKMT